MKCHGVAYAGPAYETTFYKAVVEKPPNKVKLTHKAKSPILWGWFHEFSLCNLMGGFMKLPI